MADESGKTYEIAYLLPLSLAEAEALERIGKITAFVEECGGKTEYVSPVEKRKLSYPIRKEGSAYLAWTWFTASPRALGDFRKKLRNEDILLRFLITEKEKGLEATSFPPALKSARSSLATKKLPAGEKETKPLDLEALDKKLEEILGK
jgi:ribosomal protein S6